MYRKGTAEMQCMHWLVAQNARDDTVMEFKYFSFQAWKAMEFIILMESYGKIVLCMICKLLYVLKQGQNKNYTG